MWAVRAGPPGSPPAAVTPRATELRRAWRQRAAQDLLYRTEYLATLVSHAADVQAPPGEDLRRTLASSQAPRLVSAAAVLLSRRQAEELVAPTPLALPSPRYRARPVDLKAAPQHRPFEIEAIDKYGTTSVELQACTAWQETCNSVHRMLDTLPRTAGVDRAQHRLNTLKVPPVPGVPDDAFGEDHLDTTEALWWRQVERCVHVEHLTEAEDFPDGAATAARNFARLHWRRREEAGSAWQASPGRFVRLDGGDDFSTVKFSLVEGGTTLVRQEGLDPFHSHALVTSDLPVQVSTEGHYFEVRVLTLFWSQGRADRPRHVVPRGRTEGLVLGLTSTAPSGLAPGDAPTASAVPDAWCVATSGTFYATGGAAAGRPRRPISQDRMYKPRPWHRGGPQKEEQLRCVWPPPVGPGAVRHKLRWALAVDEGDVVGLLITPFGGVALTVNGERRLMIPDAGAPTDVVMYPLIEAYNHVRSVQIVPGAVPPK